MRLNKININKLSCPSGQTEDTFPDSEVRGLTLRVRAGGSRTWYFRYRDSYGRQHKFKIGSAEAIAPEQARYLSRKLLLGLAAGDNPVADRQAARQASICSDLFDDYIKSIEKVQRTTSIESNKRNLMKYAKSLHKDPIKLIDRAKIRILRDDIAKTAGQVQANRTLASLSACWSWGLRNGVIPEGDNPASYIDKFPEKSRDRVLRMEELRLIWQATNSDTQYHRLVRFLMLTGLRRSECGGMRWSEIDGNLLVIPSDRMKGGEAHEVMLPDLALQQLPKKGKTPYVFGVDTPFSGWSGAKKRLNKAVGFDDWGLHDFRRTFSTEMNSRGLAAPHIIEATLAHIGAKSGVAGVYNTASFRPQKKEALLAWAKLLEDEDVTNAAS